MFSGIGGFELGIKRATKGKWQCIGYSEIDRYAIKTYQKHFPEHRNYGDATAIDPDELPNFDMPCGGFPCQSFSIAGKRKGFQDTRGTLFHEIIRIAKSKKPRLLFLENVKGLLSADNGRCFATIILSLDELGYDVEWQILNSKNFGVPQNRERVFIIGHSRKGSSRQVFPIIAEGEADFGLQTLTSRYFASNSNGSYISHPEKRGKIEVKVIDARNYQNEDKKREYDNISPTLMARARTDEVPLLLNSNTKDGYSEAYDGDGVRLEYPQSKTARGRVIKGSSNTLKSGTEGVVQNSRIRRLTEIECERLQGFPDGFTEGVSATQRYKQLGNAVTVNVIEAIANKWLDEGGGRYERLQ